MGTTYKVEIELSTKGSFEDGLGKLDSKLGGVSASAKGLHGQLSSMHGALSGLGSVGASIMAPFDALVGKIADVASGLAKLGAVSAFGAIAYGVGTINNELEKTQISLASMMQANGMVGSMTGGMQLAADTMAKMRKDAASLPGEFSDLANIMRTVMIPGAHAGLGVDAIRKMSAETMAAGAVTGLPMDQVAREMAQLMEGRAGAHNVLGMRIMGLGGDAAEKFNKMTDPERVAAINKALAGFAPAISTYADSFDGVSSTLVDNAKKFLGDATAPLFKQIVGAMKEANAWIEKNQTYLNVMATNIGSKLVAAFEWARAKLDEWGPVIETFARNAYDSISKIWKDAGPGIEKLADALKKFMMDPEAVDKLITLGRLYVGAKTTQEIGGGMLSLAGTGLMVAGGLKGLLGGGAAAAGTAATGTAVVGEAGVVAAGAVGGAGGAAAATGIGAILAPAAAVAAAFAAVGAAVWQATLLYEEVSRDWGSTSRAIKEAGERVVASMTEVDYSNKDYQESLGKLIESGDDAAASLLMAAAAAKEAANEMSKIGNKKSGGLAVDTSMAISSAMIAQYFGGGGGASGGDGGKGKKDAKHPGGGGTHIQKVEIVVTSNQDPSRIARQVATELVNIQRHPRVSRGTPNWSAANPY